MTIGIVVCGKLESAYPGGAGAVQPTTTGTGTGTHGIIVGKKIRVQTPSLQAS